MTLEAEQKEFLEYMDAIKPSHEEDVLKFFAAKKYEDSTAFAKKMEDEKAHAERLAGEQAEDLKSLVDHISFTDKKVEIFFT